MQSADCSRQTYFLVSALQIDADLTVLELRTRAKRSRVNVQDLNNQLATSGYVVRKGAYTSHTLTVGVLTQTRHDSRWGEVRMIAPAQVKLNWVSASLWAPAYQPF
jgi:hypothetical protein|eukprot:COSAG02_NODE_554_length_20414_cov_67.356535_9_plen_106_part_00